MIEQLDRELSSHDLPILDLDSAKAQVETKLMAPHKVAVVMAAVATALMGFVTAICFMTHTTTGAIYCLALTCAAVIVFILAMTAVTEDKPSWGDYCPYDPAQMGRPTPVIDFVLDRTSSRLWAATCSYRGRTQAYVLWTGPRDTARALWAERRDGRAIRLT